MNRNGNPKINMMNMLGGGEDVPIGRLVTNYKDFEAFSNPVFDSEVKIKVKSQGFYLSKPFDEIEGHPNASHPLLIRFVKAVRKIQRKLKADKDIDKI